MTSLSTLWLTVTALHPNTVRGFILYGTTQVKRKIEYLCDIPRVLIVVAMDMMSCVYPAVLPGVVGVPGLVWRQQQQQQQPWLWG